MPWKPPEPGAVPTLGYDVIDWITAYLAAPDRAEYEPFVLYPEQEDFVLRFYELNPRTGKRRYRRGVYSRPRGSGKSPLMGAIACAEALGPVVPAGWDAAGQPVGKPWAEVRTPLVQIAAVSESQTKNTWVPLLEMLQGPAIDHYRGLEPLDSFVNLPRGRIEPITSSPRSVKGNKPVFAVFDQALELGTMVPTPNGWTTMGELKAGDTVFGSSGLPVTILQAKPASADHDCYRVTFSDGTSVIASDGHLWLTKLAGSPAAERIRTTGEMYRDASVGTHAIRSRRRVLLREAILLKPERSNLSLAREFGANPKTVASIRKKMISDGDIRDVKRRGGAPGEPEEPRPVQISGESNARRFRIPVAPAQQLPDIELPVTPYLLGYWLGDGTRGKCELSVHGSDLEEVQGRLLQAGVESWPRRYAPTGKGFSSADSDQVNLTFTRSRGFQCEYRPAAAKALAALPCYRDKHVPPEYFRGSIEQRTELLRGLMDSDGCCTREGTCTFVSTLRVLADAVTTLLRSLGQVTSGPKWVADPRYSNGGKYRVDFTPRAGMIPFGLSRKAHRVHECRRGPGWVSISSIEPVERVAVRCIEVDSPDHLFAFGVGGHLTHNTEEWVRSNGGLRQAEVMRINAAKIGGSTIESPNAYTPGEGSVAENSANYWSQIQSGQAKDDGLYYDHREAPADTDLADHESLMAGLRFAYGDSADSAGGHVDLEVIAATIWDPDIDPQVARADFLNQITHAQDSWLSQPEWAGCVDSMKVIGDRDIITLGFDGSRGAVARGKADATALLGCRVTDGHVFEIGVWEATDGPGESAWVPPMPEIEAAIGMAFQRWNVVAFYGDPAKGWRSHLNAWEAKYGRQVKVKVSEAHPFEWWMTGGRSSLNERAVKQCGEAVVNGDLTHGGSYALTRHVLNARRRIEHGKLKLAKEHPYSRKKIDAAVAMCLAWQARLDALAKGVGVPSKNAYVPRRIW